MSTSFQELGLPPQLIHALSTQGVTSPFPIQGSAIPPAMQGRDIQGSAPTGSGKTLAFGLPVLAMVENGRPKQPSALVLVPTRELAEQIKKDLKALAPSVNRSVTAVYGGVGYGPQLSALRKGIDILVATPGRLEDLIDRGEVELGLVDIVVIDEADRMADMGFLPAVRRIVDQTNSNRQTLLFSATLDGEIAVLGRRYQKNPVVVEANSGQEGVRPIDAEHLFWRVDRSDRVRHTADVINNSDRTIVFTRTRHGADRLAKQLERAGVPSVSLHGGRSQRQRTRALKAFSRGDAAALVATDVAARGIHVEAVDTVIHYDLAGDHKDYVHRSGRTARAGASGKVLTLVTDGQAREAKKLARNLGLPVTIDLPQIESFRAKRRPPTQAPQHPVADSAGSPRSIFVGNLPWKTTAADLEDLFAEHGSVVSATISTQRTGRSKGFGFVEIGEQSFDSAIRELNGTSLGGRRIKVRPAR